MLIVSMGETKSIREFWYAKRYINKGYSSWITSIRLNPTVAERVDAFFNVIKSSR